MRLRWALLYPWWVFERSMRIFDANFQYLEVSMLISSDFITVFIFVSLVVSSTFKYIEFIITLIPAIGGLIWSDLVRFWPYTAIFRYFLDLHVFNALSVENTNDTRHAAVSRLFLPVSSNFIGVGLIITLLRIVWILATRNFGHFWGRIMNITWHFAVMVPFFWLYVVR